MMDFASAELPKLAPLARSFSADEVEQQLKQLFIDLFSEHLASAAFDVNVLGAAHLGSFELVRRAVNHDGLALLPGAHEESATRYLYRAWMSGDGQGRGLHFLRTYLQMTFPNTWSVDQLWQDKAIAYPNGLYPEEGEDRFLTSRVRVAVDATQNDVNSIKGMMPILSSCLPARVVPKFCLIAKTSHRLRKASIGSGTVLLATAGTALIP